MKKLAILAALLMASVSFAQTVAPPQVTILRNELGSGTPGRDGVERAVPVAQDDDLLHAPQYMPFYPTAGTIWPRVVEVPCKKVGDTVKCDGYEWQPKFGRAEYLFIKPVLVDPTPPIIVPVPVQQPPIVILKEVPAKKKRE